MDRVIRGSAQTGLAYQCAKALGFDGPITRPSLRRLVAKGLVCSAKTSDVQVLSDLGSLLVANGEQGTLMPAFAISAGGSLTDQQVDALVNGMRTSWLKAGTLEGANPPSYKATKPADTVRGQQAYATYCASCHGAAGSSAKSKAGSITQPAFLSLVSDQALRTIVIAGRPDIGQPDWRNDQPGHPMSDQEVTDVVSWLSSQRPKAGGGSQ